VGEEEATFTSSLVEAPADHNAIFRTAIRARNRMKGKAKKTKRSGHVEAGGWRSRKAAISRNHGLPKKGGAYGPRGIDRKGSAEWLEGKEGRGGGRKRGGREFGREKAMNGYEGGTP